MHNLNTKLIVYLHTLKQLLCKRNSGGWSRCKAFLSEFVDQVVWWRTPDNFPSKDLNGDYSLSMHVGKRHCHNVSFSAAQNFASKLRTKFRMLICSLFFISPTARLTIHTQSFPCTLKHEKNSNLNTNQIFHIQEIKPSNREKAHFSCLMWGCMHTLLYLTLLYLKFWIYFWI